MIYKCPKCNKVMKEEMTTCPSCGVKFDYSNKEKASIEVVAKYNKANLFSSGLLIMDIFTVALSVALIILMLNLPFFHGIIQGIEVDFSLFDYVVFALYQEQSAEAYLLVFIVFTFMLAIFTLFYEVSDLISGIAGKHNVRRLGMARRIVYHSLLFLSVTLPSLVVLLIPYLYTTPLSYLISGFQFFKIYMTSNSVYILLFILFIAVYIALVVVSDKVKEKRRTQCLKDVLGLSR